MNSPTPVIPERANRVFDSSSLRHAFCRTVATRENPSDALDDAGTTGELTTADQVAEGKAFDAEGFLKNPVMQVFTADYRAGKEVGLRRCQTTQYLKLGVPADGSTE